MLFLAIGLRAADAPQPAVTTTDTSVAVAKKPAAPKAAMRMSADEILKRFDKNGDGKLDEDERAEAHEAMLKEQEERRAARVTAPNAEDYRRRMLEMFDKNHDGRLDDEERAEARKYAEEHGLGQGGAGGTDWPALLKRFDKNGDGKLDEDERAEMQKFIRSQGGPAALIRQEMVRRFDKNDDHKIDEAEWTELEPVLRARIESTPMQLRRFDTNHDGKIDDAEWAAARESIQHWLNEPVPPAAPASATETPVKPRGTGAPSSAATSDKSEAAVVVQPTN
jgi:Ca2+-binding EF-hand superfamily protein